MRAHSTPCPVAARRARARALTPDESQAGNYSAVTRQVSCPSPAPATELQAAGTIADPSWRCRDFACQEVATVEAQRSRRHEWVPICDRHAHVEVLEAERYGWDLVLRAVRR